MQPNKKYSPQQNKNENKSQLLMWNLFFYAISDLERKFLKPGS